MLSQPGYQIPDETLLDDGLHRVPFAAVQAVDRRRVQGRHDADDHMIAVVPEEEGTDSINDGVNDDHQWTSNEDDGGYVSPTEFPESVDC